MLYSLCRRVLFSMQPETAHNVTMANLDWATHLGLHKLLTHMPDEDPVEVMGLRFPNTIGLAAGMDKDGIRVNAFGALGFGHVEIGTITPLAQPGNPKPRCFRVIPAKGIINRMGFNNEGCDKVIENLRSADAFRLRGGILGINIGKNAVTPIENALSDYEKCLDKVYDHADYIAVNISSPNTKNLRQLQGADKFDHLVSGIVTRRQQLKDARNGKHVPIAVKLAPDLENEEILRCVDTLIERGIDAVIAEELPRLKTFFHKPVIANISGFSVEEYAYCCERIDREEQVGIIEVNVSCPNVRHGGMSFGTSPECAAEVTRAVKAVTTKPVYIKLSPNVTDIVAIARACEEAGADGICLINTLLGMRIDVRKRKAVIANTMGGFSGAAVFPVAVRMVYQVAKACKIPVMGCGGVTTARDVIEMMMAGATAVQVGAANLANPYASKEIVEALPAEMQRLGIGRLSDIIGIVE